MAHKVACVKEGGGGGGGGRSVRKRRRERLLLHFAPYFNYPSCHFNDQSELGRTLFCMTDFTRE